MKITSKTTLAQFMRVAAVIPIWADTKERLTQIAPPSEICGQPVPSNLDGITMGVLLELQSIKPSDTITAPARITLGIPPNTLMRCYALELIGFNNFIASQMGIIAEKFDSIPSLITPQERQAGAENLNFGTFGIIDAYAKRMGITSHDDVLKVKWIHIWQVLYNDAKTALYQRRLREIYAKSK